MWALDCRQFLAGLAGSIVAGATSPLAARGGTERQDPSPTLVPHGQRAAGAPMPAPSCWLDIAAPFVVVDSKQGLNTQMLFTATCFPGVEGFRNSANATEYEVLLFDANGKDVKLDNDGHLDIPAMRPTLVNMQAMLGRDTFVGGARIRVAPAAAQLPRAGDLFSAGFVRWDLPNNFDNVHAHPELPTQVTGAFNYSMPVPALSEYHCAFALFNPNDEDSSGRIKVVDRMGRTAVERAYRLHAHQTMLYTLADLKPAATAGEALALSPLANPALRDGGVIVVRNDSPRVSFGYTLMKGRTGKSFTVEHPLHFSDYGTIAPARQSPYGPNRSFPASALIYTPLLFKKLQLGGLELSSRMYLSSSRWVEAALWNLPFVTTDRGQIAWVSNKDDAMSSRVQPAAVTDQGLVRLEEFQSCRIDGCDLPLPDGFSGGFGVATIPKTSHSLNKIEVRVSPWNRVAFTHFRPGGPVAKAYKAADTRGGLATDYIVSGAHIIGTSENRKRDCILAIMNIEFSDEIVGTPVIQIFGQAGLVGEKRLDDFAPLSCRHLLLSDLFPGLQSDPQHPLTVRMQVQDAIMIVSALHLDYERQDIALEHGSDRHSTFSDYKC